MSDNINFNTVTGKHSFFSAKERAWHGLGQIVEEAQTSAEAIRLAQLDWKVDKRQNSFIDNEGFHHPAPSYSIVRTDSDIALGTVGEKYEVIQNVEAFEFIDSLVGDKLAMFETAGALGDGETIFITCKFPDYIRLSKAPGDIIEKYLLLKLSHDGSSAIKVLFTPIRVVCNNTLDAALHSSASKNFVSIRHTTNAKRKMDLASALIMNANATFDYTEELFNAMTNRAMNDNSVKKYIAKIFLTDEEYKEFIEINKNRVSYILNVNTISEVSTRKANIMTDIYRYYKLGAGQDIITTRGTLFGAYNAISGYYNNIRVYSDLTKRFNSIIEGDASNKSELALKLAKEILNS